jgi:type I restriction enzyme M protein
MQVEAVEINCGNCGYKWKTQSKSLYTTCPHCLYKVPVKRNQSQTVLPAKLDSRALENWLWEAACSIRGAIDAPKYKDYILPLIFVKRLSDVFDDEIDRLSQDFGDKETALELAQKDHGLVRFFIPEKAKWEKIRTLTTKVGEQITDALRAIAKENPKLQGVIDAVDFNATFAGQRVVDDTRLQALIEALSDPRYRLGLKDVEPDILGRAYEYLLRKFAEGQGQSAGEFFTPKEVGWIIARIMNPAEGESVYDPTCGSGGLLIKCELTVQEKYKEVKRPLQLYGQEINHVTYAMARMNMIVHDMDGEIAIGDTLRNPKFLDGGNLRKFNIVVANPMWMQDGYNGGFYENDSFGRFSAGYPPASSADWGWIQHMVASLDEKGRAGIVIDTGAVSRGSGSEGTNKEKEIRKMFIENDLIEGVILLPENMFYNTTAAGIVLLLNKAKSPERKNQIVLINASREFEKGKPKNYVSDEGIKRIINAFRDYKNIAGFAEIVSSEKIAAKDYNLLPSRFIGTESSSDVKPLPEVVQELATAEKKRKEMDKELDKVLVQLGFPKWRETAA